MKQTDIKKLISYIDLLDRDIVSRKIKNAIWSCRY